MSQKMLVWLGLRDKKTEHALGCPHLDQRAMEELTDATAKKTIEMLEQKVYLRIGRGIVHKLLWLIGFSAVSVAAWLHSKGIL